MLRAQGSEDGFSSFLLQVTPIVDAFKRNFVAYIPLELIAWKPEAP
jgi:hypothetical protein